MALCCPPRRCLQLSVTRLWGLRAGRTPPGLLSLYRPGESQRSQQNQRADLARLYSSSSVRYGIVRSVTSKLQKANTRYENFLRRRFPRFFQLYHTFVEGFKKLFEDAKDVKNIRVGMHYNQMRIQDLPYRDMEKLRQFRLSVMKAVPLVLISIPPFANYLVLVLMYFFPRQLLIPHFWTPRQQVEFRGVYHSQRVQHHQPLLRKLEENSRSVRDAELQGRLLHLCAKVQRGGNPNMAEILAVRSLFSGPPLGLKRLSADHVRHISPLLFQTPRLPSFLIRRRLHSHALELLQLDRALQRLGTQQLSDQEVRQACYVRGVNSDCVSVDQCRHWLSQWLQISSSLKASEASLLLHNIVFLSANYPDAAKRH